jgi:hypothetical protein
VVEGDADWRLTGQEEYLFGAELARKPYKARSAAWEHDHCEFCWAKFIDPTFSAEHRAMVERDPEVLTEGYTTTDAHPKGADYYWVCPACFDDFAERFQWIVVGNSSA